MNPPVSVVIPSRRRTERLQESLDSLIATAPEVEIVVAADGCADTAELISQKYPNVKLVHFPSRINALRAWNQAAAQEATGQFLVLGADDVIWHEGWLDAALAALPKINWRGVVAFNDGSPNAGKNCTHYMISRTYAVNEMGGVMIPTDYVHYFADNEVGERAIRDKAFVYAPGALVEHHHPAWDKAPRDEQYDTTEAYYEDDLERFKERRAAGFPNAWSPFLEIVPEQDKAEGWGRVAIGCRSYRHAEANFLKAWTGLLTRGLRSRDVVIDPAIGLPGHIAANEMIRAFLDTPADSLLMIDDDMLFEPNALEKLRSNKDNWDYDVVMGFCTHRTLPPHAVVMHLMEQPPLPKRLKGEHYGTAKRIADNSVIKVDAVGLAFTLIRRTALEALLGDYGALYTAWADWGLQTEGEDIVFSRRLRERGFKLAVDTTTKIKHLGIYAFGWDDHQRYVEALDKT